MGLVLGWERGQHKIAAVTDQVLTGQRLWSGFLGWLLHVVGQSPLVIRGWPLFVCISSLLSPTGHPRPLEGGPETSFSLYLELPSQPCPLSTFCPCPLGLRVMKVDTTQPHQPSWGSQDPP